MMSRTRSPGWLRSVGLPGLATLASGAVMMAGGYLFSRDGWAVAGPAMIPAGPLISVAFLLARSPRSVGRSGRTDRARHIASLLVGLPSPGADLGLATSAATSVVAVLSGAVMVLAGYAAAGWTLVLVPPLLLAAGLIIAAAFVLIARADRTREALVRDGSGSVPAGQEPEPV